MTLSTKEMQALIAELLDTRDDEIGCDDALAGFAALAEAEIARGRHGRDLVTAVARHLEDCPECAEEYAALLAALVDDAEE